MKKVILLSLLIISIFLVSCNVPSTGESIFVPVGEEKCDQLIENLRILESTETFTDDPEFSNGAITEAKNNGCCVAISLGSVTIDRQQETLEGLMQNCIRQGRDLSGVETITFGQGKVAEDPENPIEKKPAPAGKEIPDPHKPAEIGGDGVEDGTGPTDGKIVRNELPRGIGGSQSSTFQPTTKVDPSTVNKVCGNGILQLPERCDDGNTVNGDGCSSLCQPEAGYGCSTITGHSSVCVTPSSSTKYCSNSVLELGELCDDGNAINGDGCSSLCQPESSYGCSTVPGQKSVCQN